MQRKSWIVAVAVAALVSAMATHPANAALVAGNGEIALDIAGPNSVNTGNITAATTGPMLAGNITVKSFIDPFVELQAEQFLRGSD